MQATANVKKPISEPIKNHGIYVKPRDLKKGDIIFYEMYQFLSARKFLSKVAKYVLGYYNRILEYATGGLPKICHIAIVVEAGSDDPLIIDFCDNQGGILRKLPLSKFSTCASGGKVYIMNKETKSHQANAAVRAERYYGLFMSGESKEFDKNYDLWNYNCTDFVNKCAIQSGYKTNECMAVNKSTSSRAELFADFFCINKEQMGDGYRTIILEKKK